MQAALKAALAACIVTVCQAVSYPTSQPVLNAATKTFSNGTELVVQSHHARAQTTISWGISAAHNLDRIVVYQDKRASAAWLKTWNAYSPNATASMTNFDHDASVGSYCEHSAYSPDAWGAFHSAAVLAASDVSAADKPTWFYTSTRGQDALFSSSSCFCCSWHCEALCPAPTYCVTAEAATGRPDTWPTYVEEKNYCYVYPSAVFDKLGKPARTPVLCSRDSVNLLAVSATGGSQAHQWGSVTLDVPASGLLSGLYGLDNIYVYSAVTHFNVCGVALQQQFPTAGGTVLQTQEGFVLEATAESSGSCPPPLGGAGYPLNVATLTEVVPYFGG
eukprot:19263-Heterococcus_DN1.PRE.1